MIVHDIVPFDLDKNLGAAYNREMALIPAGHWACLRDADTMFLTHDYGNILHGYVERYPHAGILTCFTNRISTLSDAQLLNGTLSEVTDIRFHQQLAESQKIKLYEATPINKIISGFLMMIKKETWEKIKFSDTGKCLKVDNVFSRRILEADKSIIRMDGLYVWHSYRLKHGIFNREHLL